MRTFKKAGGGMCDHYLVEGGIRVTGDVSEGKEGISRRG